MFSETMTDEEEQQLITCLQSFISDLTKLLQTIEMTSTENLLVISLDDGEGASFALPATFRSFEQRSNSLQHRLQRFVRSKAQRRREEISKGVETEFSPSTRSIRWENDVKNRLTDLQKTPLVDFLRAIVNALDLYVEILRETSSSNKTFRILPIFQYVQRQVFAGPSLFSSDLFRSVVQRFRHHSTADRNERPNDRRASSSSRNEIKNLRARNESETRRIHRSRRSTTGSGHPVSDASATVGTSRSNQIQSNAVGQLRKTFMFISIARTSVTISFYSSLDRRRCTFVSSPIPWPCAKCTDLERRTEKRADNRGDTDRCSNSDSPSTRSTATSRLDT